MLKYATLSFLMSKYAIAVLKNYIYVILAVARVFMLAVAKVCYALISYVETCYSSA